MPYGISGFECLRCDLFTAPAPNRENTARSICNDCWNALTHAMTWWALKWRLDESKKHGRFQW